MAVHVTQGSLSVGKTLYNSSDYGSTCQICVSHVRKTKNLTIVEPSREGLAGATEDIKGKIVEFSWWQKRQGYAESTIKLRTSQLKTLSKKGANILNPESVKDVVARQEWSSYMRHTVISTYTCFLSMLGLKWDPPRVYVTRKLPFIPTEREIDELIAGCGKKTATILQLLKETAMRIGEASKLQWKDIDFKRRLIFCNNPEKHGNSRIFNASQKLLTMIDLLPKKNDYVFGRPNGYFFKVGLFRQRKKLAKKLGNPRLNQIHFHTLRHWKATMLYHQTKDILHVKEFLGHKNIECTMIYIQLNKALFTADSDEFNCKIARNEKEVKELVEAGFEYVCDMESAKFFRKRK